MENKLNKEALQQYCQDYCDAIITEFFKDKDGIFHTYNTELEIKSTKD